MLHPGSLRRLLGTTAALALTLTAAGCGGSAASGGEGGGSGGSSSSDGGAGGGTSTGGGPSKSKPLTLSIGGAAIESTIGDATPGAGNEFFVAQITLASAAAEQVSTSPLAFSLMTGAGVAYLGDASGALASEGCRADAFVAAGGSASCSVAFVVPRSADATVLTYRDPASGLAASAQVPPPTDDLCIVFTRMTQGSCGACVEASCQADLQTAFACDVTQCVNGCDNLPAACACEDACVPCGAQVASLRACAKASCLAACLP